MQSYISVNAILFLLLVLPAGMYLLVAGLRGRRVGTDPRCAKCGYILLHLSSDNCPECGTPISDTNTIRGEHRRSWAKAVTGSLLIILACLSLFSPVTSAIQAIPWYHYKPAGWVLDDLDAPATYSKAITELQRREAAGQLSASIRQKLIERGLQEQAPITPSPRRELLAYLGTTLLAGHLTGQQKDRFLDQACAINMTVRPIVAEGDEVPFWVWEAGRGPLCNYPGVFWVRYRDDECRIDGKVVRSHTGGGTAQLSDRNGIGSSEPAGAVGKHVIEADRSYTILYGTMYDESKSRLIGRRKKTARVSYDVFPRDRAPKIELLDSPELRQQVIAAIKIKSFSRGTSGYISAVFQMASPPCDLAFEVFLQAGHTEAKMGSICCAKGKNSYGMGTDWTDQAKELPVKAKIILRSSLDVAKNTTDQTAIYSGEIEFPDVTIQQGDY